MATTHQEISMKLIRSLFAAALGLWLSYGSQAAESAPAATAKPKNWTPPAAKIRAQALAEQILAGHPELISVTFHGVPPGLDKVYTMFAGTFPDRIGNADDPDDVDVITKGITIVDPRWNKKDAVKKFVMMLPLRDAAGAHLGLLVLAYKYPSAVAKTETDFFVAASAVRDALAKEVPAYADLFKPAARVN
jgi:hypothetical protein